MSRIELNLSKYTKTEKIIGEFILKNPLKVVETSLGELSREMKVGEASIIRFCRKLQTTGFQQFKMFISADIKIERERENGILSGSIGEKDKLEDIAKKIYYINDLAAKETVEMLDKQELEAAILAICESRKIIFIGLGFSGFVALEGAFKFLRIGVEANAFLDLEMMKSSISLMDDRDTVIAISQSGETEQIINQIELAKRIGAKTICISHNPNSRLGKLCDIKLTNGYREGYLEGGSLGTRVAQSLVVEILYSGVVLKDREKAVVNKEKTLS